MPRSDDHNLPPKNDPLTAAGFDGENHMYGFLIERGRKYVYFRIARNWEVAEEIAHEGVILFWISLGTTYRPIKGTDEERRAHSLLYYFGILRNLGHRLSRQRPHTSFSDGLDVPDVSAGDFMKNDLDRETAAAIRRAIDALCPPSHRAVAQLRLYDNLSYAQIQEMLNVPVPTLHSWFHRAMDQLRTTLGKDFPNLFM